jgi:hypothetical protein
MVLQTQPDAACDLHPEGVSDAAQTMRLYANAEGYVRVHMGTKYQADARLQLDCTSADKVTTYPLHLRAGSAPTDDMPAPQATMPTPKGSRILPALTDAAAKKLSDQDLSSQGYPRRPDAVASPSNYKVWLDLVSRPTTQLPPHLVSRSDVAHHVRNIEAGTNTSGNWSGYEAQAAKGSYEGVQGEWKVPTIVFGENGYTTWSAFWIGLDGDGTTDLIQAGTEQNYTEMGSFTATNYYAWTQLLPNQPNEQQVSLSINPGDDIFVQVLAPAGLEPCDLLYNKTQGKSVAICTPLGSTQFWGSEAEWIMERPCLGRCGTSTPEFSELSAYVLGVMTNAYVFPAKVEGPIPAGTAATEQINMYNKDVGHSDNNLLSIGLPNGPTTILFQWINFH